MTTTRVAHLMPLAGALIFAVCGLAACGTERVVAEPGAVLLKITTGAPAPAPRPDELRVWVYDVHGRLWDAVRIPGQGSLPAPSGDGYGTLLVQPGTSEGPLRFHVRALAAGTRVLDGILVIAVSERGSSARELRLDSAILADDDGDDVPDRIDDCLGTANPAQGGCSSAVEPTDGGPPTDAWGDGGNSDGDAPDGATGDAPRIDAGADGASDAAADGASGADACAGEGGSCGRSNGAACTSNNDCSSGACADGVCCNNACAGACRSCNQPAFTGTCQGYAAATDPERECGASASCDGAGACLPRTVAKKPNGQTCARTDECLSGFCTDGVCCNNACGSLCESCTTGTCQPVKRADDVPQCTGKMTCNSRGSCVSAG